MSLMYTWHIVWPLVSLLGECDSGVGFPAFLHGDGQDLVSDAGCVTILIHHLKMNILFMYCYKTS